MGKKELEYAELNLVAQSLPDASIPRNINVSAYVEGKGECMFGRTCVDNPGVDVAVSSQKFMTMVSRKHASIKLDKGRWMLVDHKSTNGVLLNDRKVEPYATNELFDGDRITFGTTDSDLVYTFEVGRINKANQQAQDAVQKDLQNLQDLADGGIYDAQILQQEQYKVLAGAQPYLMDVNSTPVDADAITGFTEEEFRNAEKEFVFKYTFDFPTKTWERTVSIVEIEKAPFDKGNLRMCFRMYDWTKPKGKNLYVAKLSLDRHEPHYTYFADAEMQCLCKYFSDEFNGKHPPKRVDFVDAWIIQRIDLPSRPLLACERYLQGKYVKHSNNYGWCSPEDRNTPHAFSHFTYDHSKGTYLVVDIQGVSDVYTDPQIHSKDGKGFGKGNVGKQGVDEFFKTHLCNDICEYMGIAVTSRRKKMDIGTKPPQLGNGGSPGSRPVAALPNRTSNSSNNLKHSGGSSSSSRRDLPEIFQVKSEELYSSGMTREQYDQLVDTWCKFDRDCTGQISRKELIPLCAELGVKPLPQHLKVIIQQLNQKPQHQNNLPFYMFLTWWWQIFTPAADT